jgi:hypothetical protein
MSWSKGGVSDDLLLLVSLARILKCHGAKSLDSDFDSLGIEDNNSISPSSDIFSLWKNKIFLDIRADDPRRSVPQCENYREEE